MTDLKRKKTTPSTFSTVCPYLLVDNIEKQLEFLVNVFNAQVLNRETNEQDNLFHAEVSIGEVVIMMGLARAEWPARESMNYIFVEDVDLVYRIAISSGAVKITEPGDRDYQMRDAGFRDKFGNEWWAAQPLTS